MGLLRFQLQQRVRQRLSQIMTILGLGVCVFGGLGFNQMTRAEIVNGINTQEFQSVSWLPTFSGYCSGVSILYQEQELVLTAAHCVKDGELKTPLRVVFKGVDRIQEVGVESVYLHPKYNTKKWEQYQFRNDLAVLTLEKSLIQSVQVSSHRPKVGDRVIMVGYGDGFRGADRRWGWNFIDRIDEDMIHTQGFSLRGISEKEDGSFATLEGGDSGGALFNENHELIGLNIAAYHDNNCASCLKGESYFLDLTSDYAKAFINNVLQNK